MSTDLSQLSSEQRKTYEKLTGHPLNHNIKWPQAVALLEALGTVVTEKGDRYRVTVGDHTAVFHAPPHHADLSAETIVAIREFLSRSGHEDAAAAATGQLLVVIDHHEAKIYEFQAPAKHLDTITPYDPEGHLRHLHHVNGHFQGQRAPEDHDFYRAVARELRGAKMIVVFGHGDGHSNAADLLVAEIAKQDNDPAPQVLTEVRIDAKAFTERQLLEAARDVAAHHGQA